MAALSSISCARRSADCSATSRHRRIQRGRRHAHQSGRFYVRRHVDDTGRRGCGRRGGQLAHPTISLMSRQKVQTRKTRLSRAGVNKALTCLSLPHKGRVGSRNAIREGVGAAKNAWPQPARGTRHLRLSREEPFGGAAPGAFNRLATIIVCYRRGRFAPMP